MLKEVFRDVLYQIASLFSKVTIIGGGINFFNVLKIFKKSYYLFR